MKTDLFDDTAPSGIVGLLLQRSTKIKVGRIGSGFSARIADVAACVELLGELHGGGGTDAQARTRHSHQFHSIQSQRPLLLAFLLRYVYH